MTVCKAFASIPTQFLDFGYPVEIINLLKKFERLQ